MADIMETLIQAGSFSTFTAALQAAGLADALREAGPFTVFAPTDAAFGKLPVGAVDSLLQNSPRLKDILLYHIVPGEFLADDLIEEVEVQSAHGQSITIDASQGLRTDSAEIVQSDIETDNGIVHVIDTIMMPRVEARKHV
jgi:uncharacterized surface protein with fasciclin (FAS1) repeats